jgi:imidazole glycerol-phosphate synthase subunit HisF
LIELRRIRVIPVLLIKGDGLVKSRKFKNSRYVGDPINAVRIFNDKEVDELSLLDISATKEKRGPNIKKIAEIAGEAFMPLSYGGGITKLEEVKEILFYGIEKVIINKAAVKTPELIGQVAERFGAQSVVVSIDVKKNFFGKYKVYTENGTLDTGLDPVTFAKNCQERGAGEILLNAIDRDGTYEGYDLGITKLVTAAVTIPVIAVGGAGSVEHFKQGVDAGASAVAAGSMFVFQRPHNAVLISYPTQPELKGKLYQVFS